MKKSLTAVKILLLFLFNSSILFFNNPIILTALLLLLITILLYMKQTVFKRLKTIIPVAVAIVLFQLLFNTSISPDRRLSLGLFSAVRITLISLSVFFFLAVTSLFELVQLFGFLPKNWRLLLIMTCYFIPGVLTEAEKIKMVQKSRGLKTQNWNIIYTLAPLIIPLLHRVFQRSQTLSLTILSRGYEE